MIDRKTYLDRVIFELSKSDENEHNWLQMNNLLEEILQADEKRRNGVASGQTAHKSKTVIDRAGITTNMTAKGGSLSKPNTKPELRDVLSKEPADLGNVFKNHNNFFLRCLLSDRSRLSGSAFNLLKHIITNEDVLTGCTPHEMEQLLDGCFKLCQRANRVFNRRGEELIVIISNRLPDCLIKNNKLIKISVQNVNKKVRKAVYMAIEAGMNVLKNQKSNEKSTETITYSNFITHFSTMLENGQKDADLECRTICKKVLGNDQKVFAIGITNNQAMAPSQRGPVRTTGYSVERSHNFLNPVQRPEPAKSALDSLKRPKSDVLIKNDLPISSQTPQKKFIRPALPKELFENNKRKQPTPKKEPEIFKRKPFLSNMIKNEPEEFKNPINYTPKSLSKYLDQYRDDVRRLKVSPSDKQTKNLWTENDKLFLEEFKTEEMPQTFDLSFDDKDNIQKFTVNDEVAEKTTLFVDEQINPFIEENIVLISDKSTEDKNEEIFLEKSTNVINLFENISKKLAYEQNNILEDFDIKIKQSEIVDPIKTEQNVEKLCDEVPHNLKSVEQSSESVSAKKGNMKHLRPVIHHPQKRKSMLNELIRQKFENLQKVLLKTDNKIPDKNIDKPNSNDETIAVHNTQKQENDKKFITVKDSVQISDEFVKKDGPKRITLQSLENKLKNESIVAIAPLSDVQNSSQSTSGQINTSKSFVQEKSTFGNDQFSDTIKIKSADKRLSLPPRLTEEEVSQIINSSSHEDKSEERQEILSFLENSFSSLALNDDDENHKKDTIEFNKKLNDSFFDKSRTRIGEFSELGTLIEFNKNTCKREESK
ncbi:hypothetical protein M153_3370003599 [Pseudoloma neurophilia]|uniref:CLASP N-terminal domain-containing protein n=1 Tax=Pseudoloma neurophilia TaxID=146866 RepID=A0A0R0LY11_9MICR|nr:hypothetical protein M153_3370003599 [Pseudoloma neurophilia]